MSEKDKRKLERPWQDIQSEKREYVKRKQEEYETRKRIQEWIENKDDDDPLVPFL